MQHRRPVVARQYGAGDHELSIDISSLQSGSYRLRVSSGEQVDSRILVVVR